MLIVCMTDLDQIALAERALEFVDDGILEDWNTFTLGEVFKRTVLGVGFSFESLRDEYDRRSTLICARSPKIWCPGGCSGPSCNLGQRQGMYT